MSQYTMTVYELLQNNFDFGLNDYEIFDEHYRPILNNAILEFYKFREIGFQLPYVWRDRLRERMNRIMRDKYNVLYKNKLIGFNPLYNIDITETYSHNVNNTVRSNQTADNTSNSNSSYEQASNTDHNANVEGLNLNSQFPSEEMTENDLTSSIYVDQAVKQKSNENSSDTSNGNGKEQNNSNSYSTSSNNAQGTQLENYTKKTLGSSAGLPFSKAMLQFKDFCDKFDLDKQVIDELSDLFINIW